MTVADVAFKARIGDATVLQTFLPTGLRPTDSITVASVGSSMDGTFNVLSVEPYALVSVTEWDELVFDYDDIRQNQVIYWNAGDDVERIATTAGTITFTENVAWITPGDVLVWLGVDPASQNDVDFLASCTAASNEYCYRKRREAGYSDQMTVVPGNDVKQGAVLYAAMLYRERGALDGYASFNQFGGGAPTMSLARIMQLLGCGRPQVG